MAKIKNTALCLYAPLAPITLAFSLSQDHASVYIKADVTEGMLRLDGMKGRKKARERPGLKALMSSKMLEMPKIQTNQAVMKN